MPSVDDLDLLGDPLQNAGQQDELANAGVLHPVHTQPQPISGADGHSNQGNNPCPGRGASGSNGSGGGAPAGGAPPPAPPQQSKGAGCPGGTPSTLPGMPHSGRYSDPWALLDRSRKALPKLSLPSNYKSCSILGTQQILEAWCDKSTFAIATWQGDAQRYWLTQVLDCARSRHGTWLQSTPSQRASLEPAYILGDRKHIPECS